MPTLRYYRIEPDATSSDGRLVRVEVAPPPPGVMFAVPPEKVSRSSSAPPLPSSDRARIAPPNSPPQLSTKRAPQERELCETIIASINAIYRAMPTSGVGGKDCMGVMANGEKCPKKRRSEFSSKGHPNVLCRDHLLALVPECHRKTIIEYGKKKRREREGCSAPSCNKFTLHKFDGKRYCRACYRKQKATAWWRRLDSSGKFTAENTRLLV